MDAEEPTPEPVMKAAHHRHHTSVAHATPGRIRLKVPAARQNPVLLGQIKAAFEKHPGIDSIEVREASGSVIIAYDPAHHPDVETLFSSMGEKHNAPVIMPPPTEIDDITAKVAEEAEFLAEHSALARMIVDQVKQLDQMIKRLTGNNIDLKILVPITLATVTFLEIGALGPTPMWVTLTIFSINHFVAMHSRDQDAAAA